LAKNSIDFPLASWRLCGYNSVMARPKKKPADNRTNVLRVRLTEKERQELDQAAMSSGLEVSTWARFELLDLAKRIARKRPPVAPD
jgi:hypothetical protein